MIAIQRLEAATVSSLANAKYQMKKKEGDQDSIIKVYQNFIDNTISMF
jgi:hypothetical protein